MQSRQTVDVPAVIEASRGAAVAILLVAAAVVIGNADWFRYVTGLPRTEALQAPDEVRGATREDPMPFLIARNVLEIRVDTPLTIRDLLEKNRLNKPNLRRQVLEQLGNPSLDSTVAAGTTLKISLTPEAADVPATSGKKPQ
jgi:hypothetical protein